MILIGLPQGNPKKEDEQGDVGQGVVEKKLLLNTRCIAKKPSRDAARFNCKADMPHCIGSGVASDHFGGAGGAWAAGTSSRFRQ
jgi:hypothetical protein